MDAVFRMIDNVESILNAQLSTSSKLFRLNVGLEVDDRDG